MDQALYRKYRSRSLDEVVGQQHIVDVLKNALASGKVSHAYLFTGPRGVGKTSVARILAHEVNKLPYRDESIHLDIIEIDAASNRRIDEIRDLRQKVHIAPTSAKFKVYIIDEVHMLTKEAFNALLKTLEEPPAHCIFILATTEGHKLPQTIVSRTQHFTFRPVGQKQSAKHLEKIASLEKIDIEPEALELLAKHGDGSFRDSIGLLDQLSSSSKTVTQPVVRDLLGLPPEDLIKQLVDQLFTGDSPGLVKTLKSAREQALNPTAIAAELGQKLRHSFVDNALAWIPPLLKNLLDVSASAYPYEVLEISLLGSTPIIEDNTVPKKLKSEEIKKDSPRPDSPKLLKSVKQPVQIVRSTDSKLGFRIQDWPQVVERVKDEAASLYTALRLANPSLQGDILTLKFQFSLHQKKINQPKSKDLIGGIIESMSSDKLSIECLVDKTINPPPPEPQPTVVASSSNDAEQMQAISNIFGSAEVLES